MKDLSNELGISAGEVSESLNRAVFSGLISSDKKTLKRISIIEFLKYGIQYVFPVQAGSFVRGIETAHSAKILKNKIVSEDIYVWPYAKGHIRGLSIQPLYPDLPQACLKDNKFYEIMSIVDVIRVGKVREKQIAFEFLEKRIRNEQEQ